MIIYCLENPWMPNLVKIGKTSDLNQRLSSLYSTGVPGPFECSFAIEVDDADADEFEKLLHETFDTARVSGRREFFEVSPQHVIAAMKLTKGADVTPQADVVGDAEDQKVLEKGKKRRARFNFKMVGIEPGAVLRFKARGSDDDAEAPTAEVLPNTMIRLEGEEMSLSAAAGKLLQRNHGWTNNRPQGPLYWYFEGQSLDDRRRQMEGETESFPVLGAQAPSGDSLKSPPGAAGAPPGTATPPE